MQTLIINTAPPLIRSFLKNSFPVLLPPLLSFLCIAIRPLKAGNSKPSSLTFNLHTGDKS